MQPDPVVDRTSRKVAAALVRRFRDGEISNDQFEDAWPASPDRSLKAIATMIWAFYDDGREHRLTGRDTPTEDVRALMTRSALFADSDLPYEWPEDDFVGVAGVGWRVILATIVLSGFLFVAWGPLALVAIPAVLLLDQWAKRRNAAFAMCLADHGDMSVWPFQRRGDYERACGAKTAGDS